MDSNLTRRRLIVGAVAFSGLAILLGPEAVRFVRGIAQPTASLSQTTRTAMVHMARLLYPHDAISDDVYEAVLDGALTSVATDSAFADSLQAAEMALNAQQPQPFVELDGPMQIAAMHAVEGEPFFGAIREAVRTRLYNHPAVWAFIGYEGPSFDGGGYLNRGAGVIEWLREGQ